MKRLLILFLVMVSSHGLFADINWGTPQTLSTTGVNASQVQVVQDSNGNAKAAWLENGAVVTRQLSMGGTWSAATTFKMVSASYLHRRVDGIGNVITIWVESGVVNTDSLNLGGSWTMKAAISDSGVSQARLSLNNSPYAHREP